MIGFKKHQVILTKTRFFIDQEVYEDLKSKNRPNLIINVTPRQGKHPKGVYEIPNQIAINFIESKMGTFNWDNHHNFHQDGVPSSLKDYFKSLN